MGQVIVRELGVGLVKQRDDFFARLVPNGLAAFGAFEADFLRLPVFSARPPTPWVSC
jgi:hypothetical protein